MSDRITLTFKVFDPDLLATTAKRLAMASGMTGGEWAEARRCHHLGPMGADLAECLVGNGDQTPIPVEAGFEWES